MRKFIHSLMVAALFAGALVMAGCQSMSVPKPQSTEHVVFLTNGLYNYVSGTTADMLENGTIDHELASDIQGHLQDYKPVILSARATVRSGETLSEQRTAALEQIREALLAYQNKLQNERGE